MKLLICLFGVCTSVECVSMGDSLGTTFIIKSTKEGGRVMLNGTQTWMEEGSRKKADRDMREKCHGIFEIIEEGLMEAPNVAVTGPLTTGATHRMEKYIDFKCK